MDMPAAAASRALEKVVNSQLALSSFLRSIVGLSESYPGLREPLRRLIQLDGKVIEDLDQLTELVYEEPTRLFWRGAALGLIEGGRQDLLCEFPEAEQAALIMEAEGLLKESS